MYIHIIIWRLSWPFGAKLIESYETILIDLLTDWRFLVTSMWKRNRWGLNAASELYGFAKQNEPIIWYNETTPFPFAWFPKNKNNSVKLFGCHRSVSYKEIRWSKQEESYISLALHLMPAGKWLGISVEDRIKHVKVNQASELFKTELWWWAMQSLRPI